MKNKAHNHWSTSKSPSPQMAHLNLGFPTFSVSPFPLYFRSRRTYHLFLRPPARQETATMPAKQRTPKVSRNPDLIRGVGKYSRSQMYHKRGLWAIKAKNGGVFPRHDAKSKVDAVAEKPPKFYPAEDVKKPLANRRKPNPTKLRYLYLTHCSVVLDRNLVRCNCLLCVRLIG